MPNENLRAIERIVRGGLKSIRVCLWDGPDEYWPQKGEENGLPERNLSMHVGHKFLEHGWRVFAEASYPNKTNRRVDLLAIRKGTLVACECKQLDLADRAGGFADDVKDLRSFRLLTEWDTDEWEAPEISSRYGLLLAVTWNQKIRDWWMQNRNCQSIPENFTGRGWETLGRLLDKIDATGNASFGEIWLHRENNKPSFWALYGIFKLPK